MFALPSDKSSGFEFKLKAFSFYEFCILRLCVRILFNFAFFLQLFVNDWLSSPLPCPQAAANHCQLCLPQFQFLHEFIFAMLETCTQNIIPHLPIEKLFIGDVVLK